MCPCYNPGMSNRRVKLGVATIGLVLVVVLAAASPSLVSHYHEWQMWRAWGDFYSKLPDVPHDGLAGYTQDGNYDRYVYHRQRLVELGSIRKLHYRLCHVNSGTSASREIIQMLQDRKCPDYIDFESPYSEEENQREVTVWCYPANFPDWDRFFVEHDVPSSL